MQEARISMNGDNVVVSCDFARGSQALGCQIQLHSPMENITLNISRDDACGVVIKPSHSPILYEICALDWESDDTIGELCIPVTVNLSQVTSCADPPGPGAVTDYDVPVHVCIIISIVTAIHANPVTFFLPSQASIALKPVTNNKYSRQSPIVLEVLVSYKDNLVPRHYSCS